ncbi:hypothetical protein JKA33_04770 [Klebsiella quasipneumoniae]|uniref:hypothetical protein n=1 Tax=Klebsiella quasipneumoniae TaxID=1463165 RepID=UPI0002C41D55|nr:hypothetical protein [Klebsiella quasipneumoniae]AMR15416.1 hypothetical protein AVR78_14170 [Klebsiella quasipneumoniae]AVF88793.1 hypothetical protein AL473_14195 [Klebsiella quasipneumoniae]AWO59685.1 hypothetical protein DLJ73_00785 [Klebsiella quasipneumoniae subsp. similipneumoniae]EMR20028.1 hypothetical protein KP700603_14050 [Klebsiella quasipneumoniae]MBK5762153.1 hypothetical protein [Klebsiella quasipneumoniae]
MSDMQTSHVGIRVQIFSREATERMEAIIRNANLPYDRLALNSVQSALDSVFFFVARRDEISWLFKSLFSTWPKNPSENEKIKLHVCKPDGTTISVEMGGDTQSEKVLEVLGGSIRDLIADIGRSPDNH